MAPSERKPEEWFAEAVRCHLERHQGCPWCYQSNCVYRTERSNRLEYLCSHCGFFVCHEPELDRYHAAPGDTRHTQPTPSTMPEIQLGCPSTPPREGPRHVP